MNSDEKAYSSISLKANFAEGRIDQLNTHSFSKIDKPELNQFYLEGDWNIEGSSAQNKKPYARITLKYSTKDVSIVLSAEKPIRVKVLRNGTMLGGLAGSDVDAESYMWVNEKRSYKIVSEDSVDTPHSLELIIGESGLNTFNFTLK